MVAGKSEAPLLILHLTRLMRAGWVFAREGIFEDVPPALLPPLARPALVLARLVARKGNATRRDRLTRALNRLGPSYVKLGQFLATRRDLVGAAAAEDLRALQDKVPPFPVEEAKKRIETSLAGPIESFFSEIGDPVAAASIAQVHKATTVDGRVVALKILRPDVRKRFRKDLATFMAFAKSAETYSAEARRLRLVSVIETLSTVTEREMDLRLEAAAISEFAENIKEDEGFSVPEVDWQRTGRDCLTVSWIQGIPLTDKMRLQASGYNLPNLATALMQHFLRHAMRDGFFHADMHHGNLFVDGKGHLVAVDFGIVSRLSKKESRFLAEILWGFIQRDYRRIAAVHFEAGYVPRTERLEDFAQALRSIGEPIQGQPAEEISMAKLLGQLFEVTALFHMQTRTELLMLQKTMVVVEGVARDLDPSFNMWTASEPVLKEWVEDNFGAPARLQEAATGAASLGRILFNLPDYVERAERASAHLAIAAEKGVRLDDKSLMALSPTKSGVSWKVVVPLWASAAALVALALSSF